MIKKNLIKNYAVALFNNAKANSVEDEVLMQVTAIDQAIDNNIHGKKILESLIVSGQSKIQIIDSLTTTFKLNQVVRNFFLLLIKNSRMSILSSVIKIYNELLCEDKNIKVVQVISAKALDKIGQNWIKNFIENELSQQIQIVYDIDRTIIGGIIIKYDSFLQDYSIKGNINKIAKIMSSLLMKKESIK